MQKGVLVRMCHSVGRYISHCLAKIDYLVVENLRGEPGEGVASELKNRAGERSCKRRV